jgi:transposase
MFFRITTSKGRSYLKLVENYRVEGKKNPQQRVLFDFGSYDKLVGTGLVDKLLESGARFADKAIVLSEYNKGEIVADETVSIGPGLVFGKIWKDLGFTAVINRCLDKTKFEIPVERIIFMTAVHRIMETGSDRSAIKWLQSQQLEGCKDVELHQCYRSMNWLGEPIDNTDSDNDCLSNPLSDPEVSLGDTGKKELNNNQSAGGPSNVTKPKKVKLPKLAVSIRRTKDLIEEKIYQRRLNLLTASNPVFFDTTSLYFEGQGGTLGQRGHSKDHRPDLNQVVVGMTIGSDRYPICSEIWKGNTADITTLIPISDRLKRRFKIANVCLVADRGMISQYTIAHLKDIGWSYILGARMRNNKEVQTVLGDDGPFFDVTPERENTHDPAPLKVKDVVINNNRYIVCLNAEEARKDKYDRENIIRNLEDALKKGDKSLVGNKGYKRFLKSGVDTFSIDFDKSLADEKYDGKFILKTDLKISAAEVALQYKQLLNIESMFRDFKSLFDTRPIFHQRDENIVGHIWCSFLAFFLRKVLMDKLEKKSSLDKLPLEWADIVSHLDKLTVSKYTIQERPITIRSKALPGAVEAFKALGIRLPEIVIL